MLGASSPPDWCWPSASGVYVARHFAINSDISTLLSSDLGWRKRELAFEQAFRRFQRIFVVVEAPTPELTGEATAALTQALAKNKDHFRAVTQPGGGEFFARNGLLFQSPEELKRSLAPLVQAEPLIHDLATDPSLRGLISRARGRPARHPVQARQARRLHARLQHGLRHLGER